MWLVSKTVSDKLRAHLLSLGVDGIPASNTAVFNVLQDHGMLQPTPDGKAVWRATVTSTTGWSHSFTLLRLAPALIWESGERPAPFAGAVAIDGTPANNADALVPSPAMTAKPATDDQESLPWEGVDAATPVHLPAAQAAPDVMEDLLAMVGIGDLLVPQQDAEAVSGDAPAAGPQTPPPTSMVPVPSSAPVPTSSSAQPSGEHFMAWLKQGIATRRLVINDAKALVHTVGDTAYLVSPGYSNATHKNTPGRDSRQAGEPAGLAMGTKALRAPATASQKPRGLNIWTCDVTGPRKSRRLYGYLLHDVRLLFAEPPPNNPYLSLRVTGGSRAVQNATRRTNPQRRESERRYRLTSSFEAL